MKGIAVVLDKDAFFREFQNYLLTKEGYQVIVPSRSEEYRADWVIAQTPTILVTEILLPGRNGLDLVREVRKSPLARCSIVVYSVLSAEMRALAAGADRFIHKPVMREAYLSAIQDMTKST
ncbi:MAG TPA: response regulator [Candidatus Thermoplasmatota archaeon]|nr:response regulator [Candidatus Thermoplasmatota archaeon]